MLPEVMEVVAGRGLVSRRARLAGHRRRLVRDAVYPAVVPEPGVATPGVLWEGLDGEALARIDRFEGALYARPLLAIELTGGVEREAWVYVLRPEQRALLSDTDWDEGEFRARHLARYLAMCRAFAREEAW